MCHPILIAAGLGAAQAGLQIQGQRQQGKAQAKVQENASAAEKQRHLQELSAARLRQRQEMTASAQQIQKATTEARESRATARVSAGEAGVAGLSVDALINDMSRKEGEFRSSIQQQTQFQTMNTNLGLSDAGMRSRMNLLSINKPIEQPDYLGAILGGAQTGMSAYSFMGDAGVGQGMKTKTTTPYKAGTSDLTTPLKTNQMYS